MNDQTIRELDEAARLNPGDAKAYLNRRYANYKKGDYDRAIEDYDNAVRLCSNYQTDFIDSHFAHGGMEIFNAGIELLDSVVGSPCKSAVDFYYSGISILFSGNKHKARRRFERARELGFEDDDKITEHLENLKDRK